MARVVEESNKYEAWKNATAGMIFLQRFDRRGELVHERVDGGKTVNLTPEERRLNQELAASDDLDFFKNGQLIPVRLVETAEDLDAIQQNPNLMTDEDLIELLGKQWKQLETRLEEITNAPTLRRLLELAHEHDASVKTAERIRKRLHEVDPSPVIEREVLSVQAD